MECEGGSDAEDDGYANEGPGEYEDEGINNTDQDKPNTVSIMTPDLKWDTIPGTAPQLFWAQGRAANTRYICDGGGITDNILIEQVNQDKNEWNIINFYLCGQSGCSAAAALMSNLLRAGFVKALFAAEPCEGEIKFSLFMNKREKENRYPYVYDKKTQVKYHIIFIQYMLINILNRCKQMNMADIQHHT